MYTGTLINDLMESVVRAELNSTLAGGDTREAVAVQMHATYSYEFRYGRELVEVA